MTKDLDNKCFVSEDFVTKFQKMLCSKHKKVYYSFQLLFTSVSIPINVHDNITLYFVPNLHYFELNKSYSYKLLMI